MSPGGFRERILGCPIGIRRRGPNPVAIGPSGNTRAALALALVALLSTYLVACGAKMNSASAAAANQIKNGTLLDPPNLAELNNTR